ncbi:hypothetical protein [Methylocystis suflitae]|uniref:hypothetical protein n=1 Tax=Methylocystis suflitae TaxID=2951405 RepID=UPI00210CCCCD|nr:hypothetical protein [Methylocystis suflitae]MCQ4190083.1 hypothetical protein [Methylocystis suflitae]
MYSTLDGAKKCAKSLKRLLDNAGFDFPLNKCQAAIAKAGGFRDWRDLESAIRHADRSVDATAYEKRLLAAMPEPCHSLVMAWLDKESAETSSTDVISPSWYRNVFPYLMASAALHRSRTALLRPGSGAGQRFREKLVFGLLMNVHGRSRLWPRLDPDTLALVFSGDQDELFEEDSLHPRFAIELDVLLRAGVLDLQPQRLRVLPPDRDAVLAYVAEHRFDKAQYSAEASGEEAKDDLRQALAAIGIRNSMKVADAILRWGAGAYSTPSGPVLELLSELAGAGEIETFAKAYRLFAAMRPDNAHFVRNSIPAKISSQFLLRHRQLSVSKLLAWNSAYPEWPETLKTAVEEPTKFARTVDAMAAQIVEMPA